LGKNNPDTGSSEEIERQFRRRKTLAHGGKKDLALSGPRHCPRATALYHDVGSKASHMHDLLMRNAVSVERSPGKLLRDFAP
jgi:hypothetical protein